MFFEKLYYFFCVNTDAVGDEGKRKNSAVKLVSDVLANDGVTINLLSQEQVR